MSKKVIGIAGWSGSGKSIVADFLVNMFEENSVFKIDCFDLLKELFQPGAEAHRQIANYLGDEFLLKNQKLNEKKLWKFVYSDVNKLKILDYLLQPILINAVQNRIDSRSEEVILVESISFVDKGWDKILNIRIWIEPEFLDFAKNDLKNKYDLILSDILKVQKKLYPKPVNSYVYLFNNTTVRQLEKSLKDQFNAII